MASIKKLPRAKSGYVWRVQYRDPAGRARSKQGFKTRAEAEAWVAQLTLDMGSGTWRAPGETPTVAELADMWLATRTHVKPSTLAAEKQKLSGYVLPRWGKIRANDIKPSAVQQWLAELEKSPSTTRQAHYILAQILEIAVRDGIIASNPARGVKLPRKTPAVKVYLSAEQLLALATAAGEHRALVLLLGSAGLRWSEAAGLQVRDIDLERRRVKIQRAAVQVGSKISIGLPKTHERRVIAITSQVARELALHIRGKPPSAWVFGRGGEPLRRPKSGRDWFSRAVAQCRAADRSFPNLTPHGLRHVAAGLMISSGANVKVVQRQLGHASAAMTLDSYAELFDSDLEEIADRLSDRLDMAARARFHVV